MDNKRTVFGVPKRPPETRLEGGGWGGRHPPAHRLLNPVMPWLCLVYCNISNGFAETPNPFFYFFLAAITIQHPAATPILVHRLGPDDPSLQGGEGEARGRDNLVLLNRRATTLALKRRRSAGLGRTEPFKVCTGPSE